MLRLKWLVFRVLESLSKLRAGAKPRLAATEPAGDARAPAARLSLWVFASTIGELNAIGPLLKRLEPRLPSLSLVLLSDHEHYRKSFLAKYPAAQFHVIDHQTDRVVRLMDNAPPALVMLAEIPCLLSDAPCRLPFSFALEAKRRGAALCLVNGWLYQQRPASRMDLIEKRLFERDYLRLFDVITVQNEEIRKALVEAGARAELTFVTGNVKFDALADAPWDIAHAKSADLLDSIARSGRPVLVAGCVTNVAEQRLVLDAFLALRALPCKPLLVLAPRYPDNVERMNILGQLLSERGYRFVFRSKIDEARVDDALQCLVIDTLGELKDFYAVSTVSYVGLNKNVLEPLAFGKPVLVTPGWDPIRPGYDVYQLMVKKGFITEVQHADLARTLHERLSEHAESSPLDFRRSSEYRQLIGATDRCMEHLEPLISQVHASRARAPQASSLHGRNPRA